MSLLGFVGDFFGGLWDFAKDVWNGIKTTFNNFLEDPLPTIAAVVLQETAGVPMYVTNTAIAAARGAPMEQMVLDLAKGYVAQQAGKYVGEQLAPDQGIDVTGGLETAVAPDIFKTVLTQASAQGAKAALDGKNFNEILSSSVSGAITGYVTANIRSLGLSSQFQTDLYSKAVSAATNAILGGKSVAEAVGAAISKTTLESSVTSLTGDLKKTVDQRSDAYNQYAAIQQQAKQLYEGKDGVGTLIDQARDLERSNQSIAAARQETLNNINTKVPLFNELVELSRSQSSPERFYEILSKPELGRYTIDTDPITGQTYAFKINPITNTTEKITYFSDSHIQFMYRLQNDLQNNIERMGLMDSAQVENNKLAQSLTEQLSTKLPPYEALIDQADDLYAQITNYDTTITNQANSLQTAAQEYAQFVEDEISRLSDQVKTETNKYLEQELENAYQAKLAAEKTQLEAADALDKSYADPSEVRETLAKLGLDSFSNSRLIDQFIGKSEVGLEDTIKETLDPYILDQSELQALAEEEGYKGNYSQFQGQFLDSTQLEDWEDYVRNQFDKQSLTKDEAILKFHNAGIFDQKYIDENLDKVMSGASKWGYESAADDVVKQLKSDFLQKEQIAKQEQEQEALRQQALLKQNPSTIDDVRIAQSTQPNWLFNSRFYDENKFVGIPKDQLVQAFYDNYSNNTSTYEQVIGGLKSRGWSERGAENAFNAFSRSEGWNYGTVGPAILAQKLDAFTDRVNLTPDEVRKIANDVGYDIPESEIANYVYKNDALSASYFNLADSVKQQLDAKSVTPDEVIEYFEKQGIKDPKYIQENLPKYVGNRDEASLPLTLKNDYSAYQTQQATEARLAAERADAEKQAFVTQQKDAAEAERLRLIAEERAANQAITQPGTQPPDDGEATATEIEKIAQEVGQPTRPIEQVATGPTTSTDVAPARTIEQLQEFVRKELFPGATEIYFPGQLAGLQAIVNKLREGGFEDEFILDYLKSEQEKSADNFIDLLISHEPQQPTGNQETFPEANKQAQTRQEISDEVYNQLVKNFGEISPSTLRLAADFALNPWDADPNIPTAQSDIAQQNKSVIAQGAVDSIKQMLVASPILLKLDSDSRRAQSAQNWLERYDLVDQGKITEAAASLRKVDPNNQILLQQLSDYYRASPEKRAEIREQQNAIVQQTVPAAIESLRLYEQYRQDRNKDRIFVPDFTDIRTDNIKDLASDFSTWLGYNLGSGGVSVATTMLGALIAGVPGALAVSASLGYSETLANRVKYLTEIYKDQPPEQTAKAVVDYLNKTGDTNLLIGAAVGALDVIGGPVGAAIRKQTIGEFAKDIATNSVSAAVKQVPKQLIEEGITEGLQELVQIFGELSTGEQQQLLTIDNAKRLINNAAAGAAGSMAGSGINVAADLNANQFKENLVKTIREQAQDEIDAGTVVYPDVLNPRTPEDAARIKQALDRLADPVTTSQVTEFDIYGSGFSEVPVNKSTFGVKSSTQTPEGSTVYNLGDGYAAVEDSGGNIKVINEAGRVVPLTAKEITDLYNTAIEPYKTQVNKTPAQSATTDAQAQEETERQRLLAEEQRVAEGLRIKEENDRLEAEQQRVAEEERQRVLADQQRIAEEQRLAEERRVAEEENQKVLAEQQRQQELLRQQQEAEQARIAEQERLAAEEKLRQEALVTQQREAEEARIAEEQRQQDLLRQQQAVTTETTVMPTETQPSNDEDVVAREDVAALEARINELVAQAQAQGQSSDAALNSAINKVASDLGTSQASVLQELGKTKDELQQEFSRQFSVIGSDVQNVRNQLTDEINAARQAGLSGDAALQAAINNLSIDLGTSKEALLSQLGTTEAQLRQDVAQQISGVTSRVTDVESRLSAAIADAKAAGITGDAALQQAINNVASDLGTTKDVVLNQVGKTEQELRSEFSTQLGGVRQELGRIETDLGQAILDARASGKQGIDAVQAAVDQVAAGLGTTREDLLAKLGTTESQLRQDFASQLGGVQTQIETVQTRLQQEIQNAVASGKTGDAALQTAINKVSTDLGTTRDALLAQLGTTEAQLRQDVAQQISGVSAQVTDLESRLSAAIAEARVSGAIGDGALQAGINKVASDLGTTKEELLSQLGTTESQLKADFASQLSGVTQQVTNVESRLTSAIAEARAAGQTGDAALQSGINQVAAELGTTKEQLLAQVGKTESQLRADMQAQVGGVESRLTAAIAEARQSGLQGDAALQAGINKVAADLSTTKDIVLEQVGKTESQLRQEMQAGQAQTGQQIADLNTSLQQAINQAQAEGKAGDAALQAGINKVAGDLGTTKEALLGQLGKTEQQLRSDFATQLGGVQAQIGTVQADLTKAIADAKAQGQSDVEAVRSAVNQVSTDLGITKDDLLNRLQETESSLQQKLESGQLRTQEQIQELSTTQQQQYQQLTQSQKQLYDQMVAQGASQTSALNTAMAGVQQQITTGLAGVSAEFQAQLAASDQATKTAFANMSAAQQAEAAARVAQGQSLQQSISDVQAGLGQQITSGLAGLSAEFQEKLAQSDNATKAAFASMSAAQQAEAAARVAQGESLQKSISDVQSGLGQQLTAGLAGVSAEFQAKLAQSDAATQAAFQQMNANQQAETQARVQQGQSLQTAISDVQATLGQQITTGLTDVESRLKTAMAANEAAGLSRDQAISKAVDDVAASVGTTKDDLLSRLGQTESSLRQQYETSQAQTQAQISQLDAATQARFNQMSEAQKTQALQLAQSTQDLQGAINTVSQQTTAQISSVSKTLSDQIAANEAAGLSRDAAITKSVEDVAASLGTTKDALLAQLGTTEQGLRAEFTTGLAGVEAGLTGQIGALSQQTQAQYAALSEAQKREVEARTQMGESLSDAIAGVSTTLTGRISELSTATQQQFANLTEAQKQEVAARFQQGQDLQDAISSVESKLGTKIETGLGGLESKLNDQGRAILAQLEQQGVGYQTALQTALAQQEAATQQAISGVSKELSDVQTQFNNRVDELIAQGQSQEQATQQAFTELRGSVSQLSAAQQAQATQQQAAQQQAAQQQASSANISLLGTLGLGLGGLGALGALPGAAGAAPSQAMKSERFMVGAAPQTQFEGPLEQFLKMSTTGYSQKPYGQQPAEEPAMNYYSYGQPSSIDNLLGMSPEEDELQVKSGGLIAPLMAAGGYAPGGLNVINHSGKARIDFRKGAHVAGPGDGQSDDIPAMLADGEFVFPADVVAALGNGSTKAGSDKLYEMMHSIRARARSAKPKDLPPPALKSPLDYLGRR